MKNFYNPKHPSDWVRLCLKSKGLRVSAINIAAVPQNARIQGDWSSLSNTYQLPLEKVASLWVRTANHLKVFFKMNTKLPGTSTPVTPKLSHSEHLNPWLQYFVPPRHQEIILLSNSGGQQFSVFATQKREKICKLWNILYYQKLVLYWRKKWTKNQLAWENVMNCKLLLESLNPPCYFPGWSPQIILDMTNNLAK